MFLYRFPAFRQVTVVSAFVLSSPLAAERAQRMLTQVMASNVGMQLKQIVDEGYAENGKLVGIPGHWEDGVALVWK